MSPRRTPSSVLAPLLACAAALAAFLAFAVAHGLHEDTLRVYNTGTDYLPLKETLFFAAQAIFGTAAIAFLTMALVPNAGARLLELGRALARRPRTVVAVLVVVAVASTALVSWLSLQHTAVSLDEDLYRFQVELLRTGRLKRSLPEPLIPFHEFHSVQTNGVWTGIYPWGHMAALIPGYALGFPFLVPHLCAGIAVLLTYLLGRELFPDDRTSPLVAAAIVALSPFLAFTCGTTHNATTSIVLVNLGLYGLARAVRRGSAAFALVAGLAFGLGLHSRPLNAVALAVPAGLVGLIIAIKLRRPILRLVVPFAIGIVPGIAIYLVINKIITGDPLTPAGMLHKTDVQIFGFTNTMLPHTPMLAFGKAGTNLLRMVMWTTGSVAAGVCLAAFIAGLRRRAEDLLLLVPIAGLFGLYYFFYTSPMYDTGPFYYLDLLPVLGLIMARTLAAAADRRPTVVPALAAGFAAQVLVAFATFWPIESLAGRHVTDNNLLPRRTVAAAEVHNAIVFFNWNPNARSYKRTPEPPHPDFTDDVIYARYEAESAVELWDRYHHERDFYRLIFDPEGEAHLEAWYPPMKEPDEDPK